VLSRKLGLLDDWNAMRRDAAAFYLAALDGVGDLVLPPVAEHSDPVWHLFVVRTADPARLAEYLGERGVRSGRHYPDPIHLTEPYRGLAAGAGAFPVAEALCRDCLSLPVFPGITPTQLEQVVETVTAYFDRASV
jgi:dTDP-4-amino-4,6-dideoxygalactose transaminase